MLAYLYNTFYRSVAKQVDYSDFLFRPKVILSVYPLKFAIVIVTLYFATVLWFATNFLGFKAITFFDYFNE